MHAYRHGIALARGRPDRARHSGCRRIATGLRSLMARSQKIWAFALMMGQRRGAGHSGKPCDRVEMCSQAGRGPFLETFPCDGSGHAGRDVRPCVHLVRPSAARKLTWDDAGAMVPP